MGKPSKRLVMDEGLFHYRNYLLGRRSSDSRIKEEAKQLPLLGTVNSNGDGKNRYPHRLLQLWWVLGMGKSPLLEFYCSIENREEAIEMESQGITKGHPFGCPLTHPHWGYSFGELFYRHPHSSPLEFTEPNKRGSQTASSFALLKIRYQMVMTSFCFLLLASVFSSHRSVRSSRLLCTQ